jgi:urease accessory protein
MAATELADGTAYLMLLNPTGGMVGGDALLTEIAQDDHTRLCLTTPSANRVYRTLGPPAVQETYIRVGENARLEYVPDHLIPHHDSSLRQKLHIEVGRGGRAIIWDALAAGRIAHGESWDCREIDSRIEISLCDRAIFLNRAVISPSTHAPSQLGIARGFNYVATLIVVSEETDACLAVSASFHEKLSAIPDVYGGVSLLAMNGCVAKLLARSASALVHAQVALWSSARQIVFGAPAVDLRKY